MLCWSSKVNNRSAAASPECNSTNRGNWSVTLALQQLHWLPISHRINYKLCVLIHLVLYTGRCPAYLSSLVTSSSSDLASRQTLPPISQQPTLWSKFLEQHWSSVNERFLCRTCSVHRTLSLLTSDLQEQSNAETFINSVKHSYSFQLLFISIFKFRNNFR